MCPRPRNYPSLGEHALPCTPWQRSGGRGWTQRLTDVQPEPCLLCSQDWRKGYPAAVCVSMYACSGAVCACACVHVCMCFHVCGMCTHGSVCMCLFLCTHNVYVFTCVCTCVGAHLYVHVCACPCLYVHMCVHTCLYMCARVCVCVHFSAPCPALFALLSIFLYMFDIFCC